MTGYLFFAHRDGQNVPTDIDQMTDEELAQLAARLSKKPEFAAALAVCLAKWVRDNVKERTDEGALPHQSGPVS